MVQGGGRISDSISGQEASCRFKFESHFCQFSLCNMGYVTMLMDLSFLSCKVGRLVARISLNSCQDEIRSCSLKEFSALVISFQSGTLCSFKLHSPDLRNQK